VFVGSPKDGHVIESLELEPSAVLLIGPQSVLAAVDEVSTVPMDLTDWSEARRQEVRLDLPHGVSLSDKTKIFANISIESLLVDRSFSEVPVFLKQADDWVVDPLSISVTLRGPRRVMRRMESSDVTALVRVESGPAQGPYSATIDGTQEAFVEISHGGGEAVEVLYIDPSAISVSRP
jgi:YbbR domain-containing protein